MKNIAIRDLQMDIALDDEAQARIFGGWYKTRVLFNEVVREETVGYTIQDGQWFRQVSEVSYRLQELWSNPRTEDTGSTPFILTPL